MSNNQRIDAIAGGEFVNDLAEDHGFAGRRWQDQQFLSMRVLLVGGNDAPDTVLLVGAQQHWGRCRTSCQRRSETVLHSISFRSLFAQHTKHTATRLESDQITT